MAAGRISCSAIRISDDCHRFHVVGSSDIPAGGAAPMEAGRILDQCRTRAVASVGRRPHLRRGGIPAAD
jgi:hypothetical protein